MQQVVDVAAVTLAEGHRGTHHIDVPVVVEGVPFLKQLLCLPFGSAVVVEWVFWRSLVGAALVDAVDCHGGEKQQPLHSVALHSLEGDAHAAHVGVVVERCRGHVVAVLRGEENHEVSAGESGVHLLLVAHVANCGYIFEKMAFSEVYDAEFIAGKLLEIVDYACPDKSAASKDGYLHRFSR